MSYEILKKEFKNKIIRNFYLFYGPEEYLCKYYSSQIKDVLLKDSMIDMNYLILEEEKATNSAIIDFCDSYPIMSDKKLLIVKKSGYFKDKKSKGSLGDELAQYLSNVPEYVHIIFIDGEEVKENSLLKFIKDKGLVVEFSMQSKEQLVNWVAKIFKENGKNIGFNEAKYFIDNLDEDMQSILNETMKLINYIGDKDSPNFEDVDCISTKSLSSKVFEMIDDIAQKNLASAISKLNDMVALKEPVIKILVLIARHFRIMLQVKLGLKDGIPQNIIAQRAGVGYISKYSGQCANFTIEQLENGLKKCGETDRLIKSTSADDKLLVEKLIVDLVS